jgi:hypothetical protein
VSDRCDLFELPVDQCAHCLGHGDTVQPVEDWAALLLRPGWSQARFPGICENCRERFTAGTPITMVISSGWRAACCADEPLPAQPGRRR